MARRKRLLCGALRDVSGLSRSSKSICALIDHRDVAASGETYFLCNSVRLRSKTSIKSKAYAGALGVPPCFRQVLVLQRLFLSIRTELHKKYVSP